VVVLKRIRHNTGDCLVLIHLFSIAELLPGSVLHGCATYCKLQRATHQKIYLKQLVRFSIDNYEPGGREFESLQARQMKQGPTGALFYLVSLKNWFELRFDKLRRVGAT